MSEHLVATVSNREMDEYDRERVRALALKHDIAGEVRIDRFVAPGPVTQAFLLDRANKTKVLMGPLGGGKTTTCAFARLVAANWQPIARHPDDGKPTRMSRWLVLRDTFRNAEKSVLESWKSWFPKTYPGSTWAGGNDRPVTHTLRFVGPDDLRVEAITEFAGLNEHDIETMMKGREYDGVWLNELDTHGDGALEDGEMRVGRYPRKDFLLDPDARRMAIVIGDMNAPLIDNWTYEKLVRNVATGRILYQQPSGASPDAENMFNLEPDYYTRLLATLDDADAQRMVHNQFGYSRAGKPVFPSFDRRRHVARQPIGFDPEIDLFVGIDTSINTLNPAAVFLQNRGGRLVAIDELYTDEHGMGATRFAERLAQRLAEKYGAARRVRLFVDPAAVNGADREGGQLDAMEKIALITGLPVLLPFGGSNEWGMRADAVKTELRGYQDPETHLLFCPQGCPTLIMAIEGKYRFRRKRGADDDRWDEEPEKSHPYSDLADALQYVIGGVRGRVPAQRAAAGLRDRAAGDGRGPWAGASRRRGFDPHKVGR